MGYTPSFFSLDVIHMQGKVKWFSKEKGYGFIFGEDNQDYFYFVNQVAGEELPSNGDVVIFEPYQGKKGLAGKNVRLVERINSSGQPQNSNSKIQCKFCGKEVVPRLWHIKGNLLINMATQHLCPFCGKCMYETGGDGNIAGIIVVGAIVILITCVIGIR